ncbi:MAG: hypothetical protein ACRELY_07330, partial [Polyangiaceae bacterium]
EDHPHRSLAYFWRELFSSHDSILSSFGVSGKSGAIHNAQGADYGVVAVGDVGGVKATTTGDWAVYASGDDYGVYALATGIGVYAYSSTTGNNALFADGNAAVNGTLSKGGGSFLIDHPLDPTNKDLLHSFVESPDMKNIYDGHAAADANGECIVEMPDYFDALNSDFRYQLTPVGGAAPDLHVKSELVGGRFVIGGAKPMQKICWQVTGTRKDVWAIANRIPVEREKPAHERGLYRHPREWGQPESKGIGFEQRQKGLSEHEAVVAKRRAP